MLQGALCAALLAFAGRASPAPRRAAPATCKASDGPHVSPKSAVALQGADVWAGQRVGQLEVEQLVDIAVSRTRLRPIVPQWYPNRIWLWRRWEGTILQRVLPREVLFCTLVVSLVTLAFMPIMAPITAPAAAKASGLIGALGLRPREAAAAGTVAVKSGFTGGLASTLQRSLASINSVYGLCSGLVTFTLSFFLSQSFTLWRNVYQLTRRVQGRLNDIGLLIATYAERAADGSYTPDAEELISAAARYIRLFNMLFYSSVTKRFAPLYTPAGLSELVKRGALTATEKDQLLQSSMGHNAVLEWLSTMFNSGVADGRLCGRAAPNGDGCAPMADASLTVELSLQGKVVELRRAYASIADELEGRMPLAYTQLVQIMVDLLIFFTPFALMHSVGGLGAIAGTALVTLFHSSILNLAKMFLDPLNNDDYGNGAGISVDVATLLQETNLGSTRWSTAGRWVPEVTRPQFDRMATSPATLPSKSEAQSEAELGEARADELDEGQGDELAPAAAESREEARALQAVS